MSIMVHNHGPSEGRGIDCGETALADGSRIGWCQLESISRKAKAEGAREERERLASLAENIRSTHDVAECAAFVEGESGRQYRAQALNGDIPTSNPYTEES